MARYGIHSPRAFGVSMATMTPLVRRVGKDHALAASLWKSGWHEARVLAAFIDDPSQVTRLQMNAWARDFDNWAVCDSTCFHLFDRTPLAWEKASQWAASPHEFVKRAAFALMASLAAHDRSASDEPFLAFLPLIEREAVDDRNFVKKAVNWALRQIGKRNSTLHDAARETAARLSRSKNAACRWVGKDALREFAKPAVRARLGNRARGPLGTLIARVQDQSVRGSGRPLGRSAESGAGGGLRRRPGRRER
jgi:3-methyladenine DNA glycosylase AlkD